MGGKGDPLTQLLLNISDIMSTQNALKFQAQYILFYKYGSISPPILRKMR